MASSCSCLSSHQEVKERAGSQGSLKNLKASVPKEAQTKIVEKGHLQADYVIQSLLEVPAIVQAEEEKIARGKKDSSRPVIT